MVTKKTRSILEELDSLYIERDRRLLIENRAASVIASAVRLIEQIEQEYSSEQAETLTRKLLNAIKNKDLDKFSRSVRRTNAN
jgi:ABC-type protease/lipase transport system fused ATPase/permease subunit